MKFQFNYPRKKFHWLCPGKRQKAPTPEPPWDAGWHRRLRNCLPNGGFLLPANYIVACREERTVRRDSSQTPHFPSSCKTLITCFQLEPCLSSWKSRAFLWKDCSALSLYFVWRVMWSLFRFWSQMRSLHNFPLENHEAREPLNPCLTHWLAETSLAASSCLPRCQHRWFGCTFLISNEGSNCPRV